MTGCPFARALEPRLEAGQAFAGLQACEQRLEVLPADPLWRPVRYGLRHGRLDGLIGVDSLQLFAASAVPRPLSVTPLMGRTCA